MNNKLAYRSVILVLCTASSFALAADARKGALLFQQNHYNEAASELSQALPTAGDKVSMVNLTLGMNYQHSARLHAALHRQAIAVQSEYLQTLFKAKGKQRSKYAELYYGEALIEKGEYKQAKKHLAKISKSKSVVARDKSIANINIALADYLLNRKSSAKKKWAAIKSKDPIVLSELAAAYSRVGYKSKTAKQLITSALQSKPESSRVLSNAIHVFADLGQIEAGLKLVSSHSLDGSVAEERLGENKEIKYYDVSVLSAVSKLYNKAAMTYLGLAGEHVKFAPVADYYQAEASYMQGELKKTSEFLDRYIAAGKPAFMQKAKQLKRLVAYRLGDRQLFAKPEPDSKPGVVAELLFACARVKADCKKTAETAETMLEKLQGSVSRTLNYAVGEYYLRHEQAEKAVYFLEEARDKSQKNNIKANDPVMLVSIAEAYAVNKIYSESLEIYFEMSKEFPVVRQIQDATQGIYSTVQKSAGDVKIF